MNNERNTPIRHSGNWRYPVAANTRILAGALVAFSAGYAAPGKTATNLIAVGRANETVDNTGGVVGARSIEVERGTLRYDNLATDAVTQADVGRDCYIVDAETIARTDGGGTRSRAGIVREIEGGGVWVEI